MESKYKVNYELIGDKFTIAVVDNTTNLTYSKILSDESSKYNAFIKDVKYDILKSSNAPEYNLNDIVSIFNENNKI